MKEIEIGQSGVSIESAQESAQLPYREANGGRLLLGGKPGNKGGGRPTGAFKAFLAKLRNNPKALAALEAAACDPTLKSFGAAWKLATDYDDDKPAEKRQIVGPVEVHVKVVREGRRLTAG